MVLLTVYSASKPVFRSTFCGNKIPDYCRLKGMTMPMHITASLIMSTTSLMKFPSAPEWSRKLISFPGTHRSLQKLISGIESDFCFCSRMRREKGTNYKYVDEYLPLISVSGIHKDWPEQF